MSAETVLVIIFLGIIGWGMLKAILEINKRTANNLLHEDVRAANDVEEIVKKHSGQEHLEDSHVYAIRDTPFGQNNIWVRLRKDNDTVLIGYTRFGERDEDRLKTVNAVIEILKERGMKAEIERGSLK